MPDDRKALALGLVGLVRFVPIVVFSMISGVVADAWDRRKLMLVTQSAATCVALTLAFLTHNALTPVWVCSDGGPGSHDRSLRSAGTAGAGADAGAARAPRTPSA